MDNDGIGLTSAPHPSPWYSRLQMIWWRLIRKDISKNALVTVELDLPKTAPRSPQPPDGG